MIKVKRVRAKRFLSIGDEPVEIDFPSMGPVVHITGINRDAGEGGSNGSGKSTVLDMILYGFTGKLLKGLNHMQAINSKYKKGMELELDFDLPGVGPCSIYRKRDTKDALVFTANKKEYDLGLTETQREIEKATCLSYESLVNVSFFGQHNKFAFLSCEAGVKRKIIETLLGLEKYTKRWKSAKDRRRDIEKEIARNAKSYEDWHGIADASTRRLAQARVHAKSWADKVVRDKAALKKQIEEATAALATSDAGRLQEAYDEAQAQLPAVRERLAVLEATREKLELYAAENEAGLSEAMRRVHAASVAHKDAERAVAAIQGRIREAQEAIEAAGRMEEGVVCRACRQVVLRDGQKHFCDDQGDLLIELAGQLENAGMAERDAITNLEYEEGGLGGLEKKSALIKEKRAQLALAIRKEQAAEASLRAVRQPATDGGLMAARERIAGLKGRLEALETEEDLGNPHAEAVDAAEKESAEAVQQAQEYRDLIQGQEGMLPYYDYWIHGFGDEGIRSMVIDGVLPPLNKRIDYWLHILMDGRLSLEFKSSKMNEELQRRPPDENGFVHNALSGGEHQRIDLGLSQAFAHIASMSVGNMLSVVALDEVAANVDREGVRAVYRMISELSKERQVLVVTHDPDLQEMLSEATQLVVEKKDGITRLLRSGA